MAETNNSSSSKVLTTAIWAGAAVAITGMVVFGVLPMFFSPAPPYPTQAYAPAQQPYPGQSAPAPVPYQTPAPQAYVPAPQPYPAQAPYPQVAGPVVPQPYQPPAPQPAPSAPAISIVPLTGINVDSGYEFNDPAVVQRVVALAKQTKSVLDVPAGVTATDQNTIIAFVDPRCPYCQQAHSAMNGKYAVRYVPISVLGDAQTQFDALPNIRGILRSKDSAAALRGVMDGKAEALDTAPDPQMDKDINASVEVWGALSSKLPDQQAAVPLFVVPQGVSGTAAVVKGWHEGMPPVLDALLKK